MLSTISSFKDSKYFPIISQIYLIIPIFILAFIFQLCIIPCNSVGYGVLISLLNIVLATTINQQGHKIAKKSAKQGIALVFVFAGVRFVMIGALFAVGIGLLELNALTMVLAFSLLHLGGQTINLMFNKRH